jgi:hypothetical protein
MSLVRTLYVSRPRIDPAAGDFDLTIGDILRVSRDRNERDWVTGSLLASRTCFVQALEGDAAAVSATMARIERDPRHESLTRFEDQRIERRIFGEWSMYFGRLEQIDPVFVHAFGSRGILDPFRMGPEQLLICLSAGAVFPADTATTLRLDRIGLPDGPSSLPVPRSRLM